MSALAGQKTARIILVTGALLGLDAVRAAAEGKIHSVRMISRKPPTSLRGAPYLAANNIAIETIDRPTRIFSGSAREGARGFPANVNVAAALSLAGIGPDRTALEIWADPTVTRNIHTIDVDSDSARFTMTIENEPSAENPATSRIAPLSVIATLAPPGRLLERRHLMARYSIKTFGFRGSWGQIQRIEEGFRHIGCHVAGDGEEFDFIYSNELLQGRECRAMQGRDRQTAHPARTGSAGL